MRSSGDEQEENPHFSGLGRENKDRKVSVVLTARPWRAHLKFRMWKKSATTSSCCATPGRKIRLDDYEVFQIHTRANTQRIVRREYLEASWGRRPIYPRLPLQYSLLQGLREPQMHLVAVAKRANGTLVLSDTQKFQEDRITGA
ncbi:hypothetical protein AAMO2058_000681400 [Amorphochlora amoebiformis]